MDIRERIIFEDNECIIVNKPAGMLVQSDKSFDVDLISNLKTYLKSKNENIEISVINRLDRPVCGLVLVAKTKAAAAKFSKELNEKLIDKDYYAVIQGQLENEKGELCDYLIKDSKTNTSRVILKDADIKSATKTDGKLPATAKPARLYYETCAVKKEDNLLGKMDKNAVVGAQDILSLVRIHLLTGRHHQIRVQLSSRNCPILGDIKYGKVNDKFKVRNVTLCSYHLGFSKGDFKIVPHGDGFSYFEDYFASIE